MNEVERNDNLINLEQKNQTRRLNNFWRRRWQQPAGKISEPEGAVCFITNKEGVTASRVRQLELATIKQRGFFHTIEWRQTAKDIWCQAKYYILIF